MSAELCLEVARQMPGNGTYAFGEPANYEAAVEEAKIELLVTEGGKFEAVLTRARLNQLWLSRSRETLASVAYVALRSDLIFVTFPTGPPPPIWGGRELQPGEIVLHSRGGRMHQRTVASSEKGLIAVTPEHLALWSRALTEKEVVVPPVARIIRPATRARSRLSYLHASACGLVETSPATIAHPEVIRALEQELIRALINCLTPDDQAPVRSFRPRRMALMNRFEDVLAAHHDRPLHVPELCIAIGVSERTLRTCCAEFLGMSPGRYLRLRQLKMVRTALQTADPTTTSVGAIARRYGETPSATLQARRRRSPRE